MPGEKWLFYFEPFPYGALHKFQVEVSDGDRIFSSLLLLSRELEFSWASHSGSEVFRSGVKSLLLMVTGIPLPWVFSYLTVRGLEGKMMS